MVLSLRVFLLSICIVFLCIIIAMLRKDRLHLKYTLVWLLTCFTMLLFSIFPEIVFAAAALIGIIDPVNAMFLFATLFILLICFTFTVIMTRTSARVKALTQGLALLEERVRTALENKENR